MNLPFEIVNDPVQFGCLDIRFELYIQCEEDFIRAELNAQRYLDFFNSAVVVYRLLYIGDDFALGCLTDQETLALIDKINRHDGQYQTDDDRRNDIWVMTVELVPQKNAQKCNQESRNIHNLLPKNNKDRWILAGLNALPKAFILPFLFP